MQNLVRGSQDMLACFVFFLVVVPHITDAVQEWVMNQAKVPVDDDRKEPQICVIEASIEAFKIYIHNEHKQLACFLLATCCKKVRLKFHGEQQCKGALNFLWFVLKETGVVFISTASVYLTKSLLEHC